MVSSKLTKLILIIGFILVFALSFSTVSAAFQVDLYFNIPETVYEINETISLKGTLFRANITNGTLATNLTAVNNENVTMSIFNSSNTLMSTANLTTNTNGQFFSNSSYLPNATTITAPSAPGTYTIKAVYTDPDNSTWNASVGILVINQTVDQLKVTADKSVYIGGEEVVITAQAIRIVGDYILYTENVSINGTIRDSNKNIISFFNCTTDTQGQCLYVTTANTTNGEYIVELDNFKTFTTFTVSAFDFTVYMKDELGQSLKNTFSKNEQASVDVTVFTNRTDEIYTFDGYISDASGNVVKLINTTTLDTNNSYNNRFVFTADSLTFDFNVYTATVTVTKTGGGSITSSTSFEVRDWTLGFQKRDQASGFEYSYSTFGNQSVFLEIYPKYRSNGSVLAWANESFFNITLEDKLGNQLRRMTPFWNISCGLEGCYEFSFTTPSTAAKYTLIVALADQEDTQTAQKTITVIDKVISAQTTNNDGDIKELFGTNEFVYLTMDSYNTTDTTVNLTNAEIVSVTYMNGSSLSYSKADTFSDMNISNSDKEWAWNTTLQRFKLTTPRAGGLYDVIISANNGTLGATARFLVNPYDICVVAKNTPGDVNSQTGYYYAWQFQTTDTIYFEMIATQANNPTGKAEADNFTISSNSTSHGMASACTVDTQQKQVVSNATVVIEEVKNTRSGKIFTLNTTESSCQASDNEGKYTCTVKATEDWDGGSYSVQMKYTGEDQETTDIVYGLFEARAFYVYGWADTWQNKPSSNITLTVQMYEAGNNWWSSYGSAGLSGSISVEKIEYEGNPGDEIWPPLTYNYTNISNASTDVTTGQGSIILRAEFSQDGQWRTGRYRAILKATDDGGNVDYGYAYFEVKRWDVYGIPVDCDSNGCSHKSYFNSKDNISLFIRIVEVSC